MSFHIKKKGKLIKNQNETIKIKAPGRRLGRGISSAFESWVNQQRRTLGRSIGLSRRSLGQNMYFGILSVMCFFEKKGCKDCAKSWVEKAID